MCNFETCSFSCFSFSDEYWMKQKLIDLFKLYCMEITVGLSVALLKNRSLTSALLSLQTWQHGKFFYVSLGGCARISWV